MVLKKSLVIIAVAVSLWWAVPAHAFFGANLLPFGDYFGLNQGCGSCEEPCRLISPPTAYVGWNDDPLGIVWSGDSSSSLAGATRLAQRHRVRGWWVGVTQPVNVSENLTILGSGWYLFPQGTDTTEYYNTTNILRRTWSVQDEWWFVDGVAAFQIGYTGGFSLLAGLRYDYFYSKFSNPVNSNIATAPADEATAESKATIPLLGTQYAVNGPVTSLAVRFVGFPTVAGSLNTNENIGAGAFVFQGSSNYQGGYFFEFFSEASRQFAGAKIGAFVRWSAFHGKLPSFDVSSTGIVNSARSFDFAVDRHSWTVGGTVSVAF